MQPVRNMSRETRHRQWVYDTEYSLAKIESSSVINVTRMLWVTLHFLFIRRMSERSTASLRGKFCSATKMDAANIIRPGVLTQEANLPRWHQWKPYFTHIEGLRYLHIKNCKSHFCYEAPACLYLETNSNGQDGIIRFTRNVFQSNFDRGTQKFSDWIQNRYLEFWLSVYFNTDTEREYLCDVRRRR